MSGMPKHTGACSGLRMEDGDEIDTLLHQTGGGGD
ncbi:hypothetical protein OROGR_030640 [Orobanche gracilis]